MLMLSELLTPADCKSCRLCCSFDSYDLWETPVIDDPTRDLIQTKFNPAQPFIDCGDYALLRLTREADEDLYYCSMLDRATGCKMGADKPFDCRIWPLRVMEFESRRVIVLSPVCPVMITRPLDKLSALARRLAPMIFEQADKTPPIVKKYLPQYPILFVECGNHR
ncbi:MAG: hypothetical protein QM689_07905 [Oscillospiraceae bacterium]